MKGIKRYKPPGIKQATKNVIYIVKNTVNNVITLYGDRWLLHLSW